MIDFCNILIQFWTQNWLFMNVLQNFSRSSLNERNSSGRIFYSTDTASCPCWSEHVVRNHRKADHIWAVGRPSPKNIFELQKKIKWLTRATIQNRIKQNSNVSNLKNENSKIEMQNQESITRDCGIFMTIFLQQA